MSVEIHRSPDKNADSLLNHMRTEVQKIIDNHLKWEKISVMNYGYEELNLLIDLFTWRKSQEDVKKELAKNVKRMKITYEQIVCEYDFIKSLKNLVKETKSELALLNDDLLLGSQLESQLSGIVSV